MVHESTLERDMSFETRENVLTFGTINVRTLFFSMGGLLRDT